MLIAYVITLLSVSLLTMPVYAVDRINAAGADGPEGRRCVYRVPEIALLTLSAMGGALGAILAGIFFKRKANVRRGFFFFLSVLFSSVVQLVLIPLYLIVY